MNNIVTELMTLRYSLILIIANQDTYLKFNKMIDTMLMQKRFDNQYDLSLLENIIRADNMDFSRCNTTEILASFFSSVKNETFLETRSLYELVKLSYFPVKKLKLISDKQYETIIESVKLVSRETKLMSYDFLILTAAENFFTKTENCKFKLSFQEIRDNTYKKLATYDYLPEKREKETNFLCWIDKILTATINKRIKVTDFVNICKKIMNLTTQSFYTYRKSLNSIIYLLRQQEFSADEELRLFKHEAEKKIEEELKMLNITSDDLMRILIKILAEEKNTKEDFYYLFDAIGANAKNSEESKLFSIQICNYIIYYNQKFSIFNSRFVRKYFSDKIFEMIEEKDSPILKEQELDLLVRLFKIDLFLGFNGREIINIFVKILTSLNQSGAKLNQKSFYRYCEVLDYLLATNEDIDYLSIITQICTSNPTNKRRVLAKFQLCQQKNSFSI